MDAVSNYTKYFPLVDRRKYYRMETSVIEMEDNNMEASVIGLEMSVQQTNKRLESIVWQLNHYDARGVCGTEEMFFTNLLQNVNQVREEYENLRLEILEIQRLQKQLSSTLKHEIRQVQGTFSTLREKVIGKAMCSDKNF